MKGLRMTSLCVCVCVCVCVCLMTYITWVSQILLCRVTSDLTDSHTHTRFTSFILTFWASFLQNCTCQECVCVWVCVCVCVCGCLHIFCGVHTLAHTHTHMSAHVHNIHAAKVTWEERRDVSRTLFFTEWDTQTLDVKDNFAVSEKRLNNKHVSTKRQEAFSWSLSLQTCCPAALIRCSWDRHVSADLHIFIPFLESHICCRMCSLTFIKGGRNRWSSAAWMVTSMVRSLSISCTFRTSHFTWHVERLLPVLMPLVLH